MSDTIHDPCRPLALRAGPLTLIYHNGLIRSLCLGDTEIVRRVYVAVRDEHWNTIQGDICGVSIEQTYSSFAIGFSSRHKRGDVDFEWQGKIAGDEKGRVSFSMKGRALSTFRRNRIGFCVLHPLSCRGRRCRTVSPDGSVAEGRFPENIAPHQPFVNIMSMSYAVADDVVARIDFEGDKFETEDQRNWTDASFKTYSTPADLPNPVAIESGSVVEQSVSISLEAKESLTHTTDRSVTLRLDEDLPSRLPAIGVMLSEPGVKTSPKALHRLKVLELSHLRLDVDFKLEGWADHLRVALDLRGDLPLELALFFDDAAAESASLASVIGMNRVPIRRFLVHDRKNRSTPAHTIEAVRDSLVAIAPEAAIVGGTDYYFVEINRRHPPVDQLDGVCYSATPQVHTFDDVAVMENLPGILETAAAARTFTSGREIAVTPLTLRPRKRHDSPLKDGGSDPRLPTLFGAAWLLGSIACAAEGGVASLTLGDAIGEEGIIGPDGRISPVYVLLSWLKGCTGLPAACYYRDFSRIVGLELVKGRRRTLIIANLTDERQPVTVSGRRILVLDEDSWREGGREAGLEEGPIVLDLKPYALVRIT